MQAHDLKPARGSRRDRKRVGRGNSAGTGTYSGRGLKGQKSRAGRKPRRFFEGGQTRLLRRLPHRRGFTNQFRIEYQPVNLKALSRFESGTEVTNAVLKEAGLIDSLKKPVKILGWGEISVKLDVKVERVSQTAKEKIEAAGGTAEETTPRKVRSERRGASKRKKRKKVQPVAQAAEGQAEGEAREEQPSAEAEPVEEAEGDGDES
jgi:large subunit ribosomal protein L15